MRRNMNTGRKAGADNTQVTLVLSSQNENDVDVTPKYFQRFSIQSKQT